MKYAVITFGCRVNQADSLKIEEALLARGATAVPSREADVVVVNTCSVTATADQGARQAIRRIARENPAAAIVATGCYATRCQDEVAALPHVVRVVRNDDKTDLAALIPQAMAGNGPCGQAIEPGVAGRTAFTVRAQTGCEEVCAYCVIPSTRGRSRSVPPETVVADTIRAADAGFKEVILTGVHLGSYGRDLRPLSSLLDLLGAMERIDRDVTFRISSLEPMDCPPAIVDLVARSSRFLPHFHLPLQHASDAILRAMRRPYTLDQYRRLVDVVRARLPHASIGSDVIAGFPGETDDHFEANLRYLPDSPLTHLHVFPYSDRPGTAASTMGGKIHGATVRDRGARLRAIGGLLTGRFRASQIGAIRPGLTLEDGTFVVTDNYLKVRIAPGLLRNTRVRVRIERDQAGSETRPEAAVPAPAPAISAVLIP
jgi:threonylcarbamoyladenosine tRNA methylthiotransferase MtaB